MLNTKYKSVSMKIKSWELCTEISKQMLNGIVLSRSQIVEMALRRMANEVQNKTLNLSLEQFEDIKSSRKKQPDLPKVGTADTHEKVVCRNNNIYFHRCVAKNKLTLQQLATMYNLSRERVRQIQERMENEVSTETLKPITEDKHASDN